jgi:hypothetical protein
MASIPPIALYPSSENRGLVCRVLLAECRTPAFSSYTLALAKQCMEYMAIVLYNRRDNPSLYGASGANLVAVVTAPGQFAGFGSYPTLTSSVQTLINDILKIANNTSDSRFTAYRSHVQASLDIANQGSAIQSKNPSPQGPLAFWRTDGSSAPGGRAVLFKDNLLNNDFYYTGP